jgi:CNT family concentrative nucleoside transporter
MAFLNLVFPTSARLGRGHLNAWLGLRFDWSFGTILGYVFILPWLPAFPPTPWPWRASWVSHVATEVPAIEPRPTPRPERPGDPRSAIIAAYSLRFPPVASLAIFVGGIGALAPSRLKDLSRLGFRALLAATLAGLMTGAVAGAFFTRGALFFGR